MTKASASTAKTSAKTTRKKRKSADRPRTALVVLGMHRSGTSALAGVLNLMGCDMPKNPMVPNPDNPKGFFESSQIYAMHSKLLASAGSRWDDWLPINDSWYGCVRADEYHETAVDLIGREFGTSRLFVLKDPRICRLVPFWEEVFEETKIVPQYVMTHRNPVEVARSLSSRNQMAENVAMLIWLRHVLDAEATTRGKLRCFVSYDGLMTSWGSVVKKIESAFDLILPRFSPSTAFEVETFLDTDLQHQRLSTGQVLHNPTISEWVRTAYGIMEAWANGQEVKEDYETLDTLRAALSSAATTFGPMLEASTARQKAESERHAAVQTSLTQSKATVEKLGSSMARVKEESAQLSVERDTAIAARLQTEQQYDAAQAALSKSETNLKELHTTTTKVQDALDKLTQEHEATTTARQQAEHQRDAAHAMLTQNEATLENLQTEMVQIRNTLSQTQSALAQRSLDAEETHCALDERTREMAQLHHTLDERTREMAQLHHTLDERTREMAQLHRTFDERTLEVVQIEHDLTALQSEQAEHDRQTVKVRTQLSQTTSERDREAEQVKVLTQRLTHQTSKATALEEKLTVQYREMADLTSILRDDTTRGEQEIAAIRAQHAQVQDEVAALQSQKAETEATVEMLLASTSWRLTRPMRKIVQALRGQSI